MLADSSWAIVRKKRGCWGEMELRGEGRQWLNTGLTIKAAQSSVFFEVCSSAESAVTLCNLLETTRHREERARGGRRRELKILCDSRIDTTLSKHYLLLPQCWSITCHSTILLFPFFRHCVPSVGPRWGQCWSQCLQPAVRQEPRCMLGTQGCKRVHAFDDLRDAPLWFVFMLSSCPLLFAFPMTGDGTEGFYNVYRRQTSLMREFKNSLSLSMLFLAL